MTNYWSLLLMVFLSFLGYGQQVAGILNYSTDVNGRVRLEVNSSPTSYYVLNVRHHPDSAFSLETSVQMGETGTTIITEPLGAYPEEHYQVLEYPINNPFDTDYDGIDDIEEYNNLPINSPINTGETVTIENGLVAIDELSTFNELSVEHENVQWQPFLNGKEYVKFLIDDFDTDNPKVYFINTNTHPLHVDFATHIGINHLAPDVVKGQVVFHPTILAENGVLGTYAFNYSNNESMDFLTVQRTQELLAANMLFLENNLSYYINVGNEPEYDAELTAYQNSRVSVVFETDVYAGVDYWGLNQTEGYGFFRLVSLEEVPGPKDIVLYESLPNSLPRVGGIITSVIQTPLSHVNLRAIQDHIPNAFIRDPLAIDTIANLLNKYIYFNVEQSSYTIREATLEEVNAWYEKNRPQDTQLPPLNLDYKRIKSLDEVTFDMFDGFGAKSANVATMRRFDFPEGTIPSGFAVPFYFYQEFMKHNHFFDEAKEMISNASFISDRNVRDLMLAEFRERIESAEMPQWMLDDLAEMHAQFPLGASVRCRSSTNNEDLPGFSGAGLYESKTQHPDEGHISKSIKQVYASLWNLRAFEERDFYRIDHFYASMGVLCHENYKNEKVNGVGVSADPVYNTSDNFYLNSQLASELITNPGGESRPEELLLHKVPVWGGENYSIIQHSSLVSADSLLMTDVELNDLRAYLTVIHDEFAKLYNAEDNSTFAMDIEYKINSNNQLIIKQARPWVSYVADDKTEETTCELIVFPNPASDHVNVTCRDCDLTSVNIFDLNGQVIETRTSPWYDRSNHHIKLDGVSSGIYIVSGIVGKKHCATKKLLIHRLE